MFKHKNALAALMAVVMLLSLTACGGKKTEQAPAQTPAQTEQPAEAPAASDLTEWEQSSGRDPRPDRAARRRKAR